jgi:hypothetical protein
LDTWNTSVVLAFCSPSTYQPYAPAYSAEFTNASITWSPEARTDLERFGLRLDGADNAPAARFADHVIVPDTMTVTVSSDASGKDTLGVGGYTPTTYACA